MIVINSDRGIDTNLKTSKPNSLEYPLNGTIGLNTIQSWWGNTVFTKTGDWNSVSLKTVGPGQTFGCVYFSISFFLSFFFALRSTLLCSFSALVPYRDARCHGPSPLADPRCGRPFSPLPSYPLASFRSEGFFFSQYLGRFPPSFGQLPPSPIWVRYTVTAFRGMCSGT